MGIVCPLMGAGAGNSMPPNGSGSGE